MLASSLPRKSSQRMTPAQFRAHLDDSARLDLAAGGQKLKRGFNWKGVSGADLWENQSTSSTISNSFVESDFRLPDLELNHEIFFQHELLQDRKQRLEKVVLKKWHDEEKKLTNLDVLHNTPAGMLSRKGIDESPATLRNCRRQLETDMELQLAQHVVKRKPGEFRDKLAILRDLDLSEEGEDEDHAKLGSTKEKLEDLRQEDNERWFRKHGKSPNLRYTNEEKRLLRKWFQELDYDGSGEVNVEELQDPMLSSGILKTREQVVRVLANVDRNNTMGIDFEEFLLALSGNKLADQGKLRDLQAMSGNPYGFSMDTLITEKRRAKLLSSIVRESEKRQGAVDQLFHRYADKPKMTRKEGDQFITELEMLDEKHTRSQLLHMKYIGSLDGVLKEKKNQYYQEMVRDNNQQLKEMEQVAKHRAELEGVPVSAYEHRLAKVISSNPKLKSPIFATKLPVNLRSSFLAGPLHTSINYGKEKLDELLDLAENTTLASDKPCNPYSIYAPATKKSSVVYRRNGPQHYQRS